MVGGTPCRGYDPVRRTTGRTGLSDRPERRRAGFGDDEFHPGELPGGGNFRCRSAGGFGFGFAAGNTTLAGNSWIFSGGIVCAVAGMVGGMLAPVSEG